MGVLGNLTAVTAAAAAIGATIHAFGGEDPLGEAPGEENWHHEGLSRQAARAAGWSEQAENAVAFHADYLDSYLYNPLWWFDVANGGGPGRLPVVMSSKVDLTNMHFDDLIHPESVRGMWRRYLSGTAAGLIWLGHVESGTLERRVGMAHNLIGASLHALQDFYSHSNWIDAEELRTRTWFEVDPERRACLSLWTGTYELPEHFGIKPHGAYLFACTVINNLGSAGRDLMSVVCHAASPFAGSSMCRWFDQCQEAKAPEPPAIGVPGGGTVTPPQGIVWVEQGINVDNHWIAEWGAAARGLTISGRQAFEVAYELAFRTSCQWLRILDRVMADADLEEFWRAVKSQGTTREQYKTPRAPWEDFAQIPYRFLSAGPYPPPQAYRDTDAWYLRLLIRTSGEPFSGTDADIIPFVNGRPYPALDHGVSPIPPPPRPGDPPPPPGPPMRTLDQSLLGRNDFEAGDLAAYMIGPLDEQPRTIALVNAAPDAGDVIDAAARALWRAMVDTLNLAVEFFKGLWGYHADFVDEDHVLVDATTLTNLAPGSRHGFLLSCNGGSEGFYEISGYVEGTAVTGAFANGVPWRRFRVRFENLRCVKESEWDRFTDSDEPFVLGLVIPHGSAEPMMSWRTGPYGGVDSGETVSIGYDLLVQVPQRYGFLTLACAVYESDDETPAERDALLDQFAGSVASRIVPAESSFLEVLGASIASGWRPSTVEAVAFRRDAAVEVRAYEPATFDRWIDGGDQIAWTLTERAAWRVDVPDVVDPERDTCAASVVQPPLEVEIPRIDFRPRPGERRHPPGKDRGRQVPVDLAEFDPRARHLRPGKGAVGTIDEPRLAPAPTDDCPPDDAGRPAELAQSGE
jgi:hypothetical protein